MRWIVEIFLTGLAIYIAANLIPGVHIHGFFTAVVAGILLGLVNATIGLVLRIITLPISILTLGLFSFVISVLMVLLVSHLLDGFYVAGFVPAALFAIVMTILKMIFHGLTKKR